MNFLDEVKSLIGNQGIETIASMLGENTHNTQIAANSGVATILATLMKGAAANNGGGAANLLSQLTGSNNGDMLGGLAGLLGGSNNDGLSSLISNNSGLISSLLGDKAGNIAGLLGSISGIKSSSATSLLSLAAPIVMNLLGKKVSGGNLGASGLLSLLLGQSDAVKAALPSGLSNLLGFSDFDGASILKKIAGGAAVTTAATQVATTKKQVTEHVEAATTEAKSGFGNLLPWILGALFVLGALWYFKGCGMKNDVEALKKAALAKQQMMADSLVKYTDKMKAEAANAVASLTLPGDLKLDVPKGSLEEMLVTFIQDKNAAIDKNKWFTFDRLTFDTGKATLQATSKEQLDNIASVMKAFPAVTIKLGGYTDNVGNAASNKKLSDARAKTVLAELVSRGVASTRMTGEGYGQEHPVCEANDTEACRQQNRRIDVSVRTK